MAGPFTTPVAFSTPFDSEPDRSNGFQSKNVQEAIEEALALAVSNDRYLVLAKYNGNANNNRLLEFYAGIDSQDAPLFFSAGTNVLQIVLATTSMSATCNISFYDVINDPGLATPLYTIVQTATKRKIDTAVSTATPLFTIPIGGAVAVRVTSGSILTPHMQIVFSSSI